MGILDIGGGRDADDESSVDDATDAERGGRGGRRLLLAVAVVGVVGVALYLRSRRRAAREAEFTEIELEPTDVASESESTSTE
jgi:hypothetical protein